MPNTVVSSSRRRRSLAGYVVSAVVGVALAAVGWAVFKRRRDLFSTRRDAYSRRPARPLRPALIVNRWSGDGKAEKTGLAEAAEAAGVNVIMLEPGDDIVQLAETAVDEGADAIGAAGGDGSLGLVAGVAVRRGVPFFCIPVGTRNHFALDLGLDRDDPIAALGSITDGEELLIDIGMADERPFLNNVSFGIYASAVHRDEYRANKEETLSQVAAEFRRGEDTGSDLRFSGPRGGQAEKVAVALVSNGAYIFSGPPDFGRRPSLASGMLGINAAGKGTRPDGRPVSSVRTWQSESLRIEADGQILAGLDGEAVNFDSPLELSVRPKSLRVLVPRGTSPGYRSVGEAVRASIDGLAALGGAVGS